MQVACRDADGGLGKNNPSSLLDNSPLSQLLRRRLDLSGIRQQYRCRCALRIVGHGIRLLVGAIGEFLPGCAGTGGLAAGTADRHPGDDRHRAPAGIQRAAFHFPRGAAAPRIFRRRQHAPDRADQSRAAPGRGSRGGHRCRPPDAKSAAAGEDEQLSVACTNSRPRAEQHFSRQPGSRHRTFADESTRPSA